MRKTAGSEVAEQEQHWRKAIGEGQEYPGGVTAYCSDKGISKSNYYSWLRRLRMEHPDWDDLAGNAPRKSKRQANLERKQQAVTEVAERPSRRKFNAEYKARILREADAASKGELAVILRREGLYSSHLHTWRHERELKALAPKKRGKKGNPLTTEVMKLKAQNAKLEKQLDQANKIIELQKKVSEILGVTLAPIDEED
jgi:transposase-like protein